MEHETEALLLFAARTTFAAENIAFLRDVDLWKRRWDTRTEDPTECFLQAGFLYHMSIDTKTARFPINVSWRTGEPLKALFSNVKYAPTRTARKMASWLNLTVTPWEDPAIEPGRVSPLPLPNYGEYKKHIQLISPTTTRGSRGSDKDMLDDQGGECPLEAHAILDGGGGVPPEFNVSCFDAAYDEIKQLVLENIWPSYSINRELDPPLVRTDSQRTRSNRNLLLDSSSVVGEMT